MKTIPLTGPEFSSQTPDSFISYVKSLIHNKTSKEVQGVSISISGSNKLTIRFSRETKVVSREELSLLAKEYKQDEQELLKLFRKRKIEVIYDDTDNRRETETPVKAKKNAGHKRSPRRKKASVDQLLEPSSDTRLHEESGVQSDSEVKT